LEGSEELGVRSEELRNACGDLNLIVIAGPTATGKTETAVALAEKLDGEIVCADSMQVYRGLDIGTAMPSREEMRGVKHHLLGYVDPDERYSLARYLRDCAKAVDDIQARGRTPILCGGTGLYISSFIHGVELDDSEHIDYELRSKIEAEYLENGAGELLSEIEKSDAEYAKKLHPNDKKRIVRAVELLRTTGYTIPRQNELSKRNSVPRPAYLAALNCSDRATLYERINTRVDGMMKKGLLEEAEYVYQNRGAFVNAAQAIGYKEFFGYFEGTSTLDDCTNRLKQATRNYAKRQISWFNVETLTMWYYIDNGSDGCVAERIDKEIKKEKKG